MICDDLLDFAHGELEADDADIFRAHLKECEDCQAELCEVMQLSARLSTMNDRGLPRAWVDDPDVVVVDDPAVPRARRDTRLYDMPLRTPAPPVELVYPILAGFVAGAPVDTIADGLSAGQRWIVGPAAIAGACAIWLLDLDLPYESQLAAWRVIDERL